MAKDKDAPGEGAWFWPRSRLYTGERLRGAARRVAREVLGLEIGIVKCLDVHEHVRETSAAAGSPSQHTVKVVFHIEPATSTVEIDVDDQHTAAPFVEGVDVVVSRVRLQIRRRLRLPAV